MSYNLDNVKCKSPRKKVICGHDLCDINKLHLKRKLNEHLVKIKFFEHNVILKNNL
jgi:hypothetical protein